MYISRDVIFHEDQFPFAAIPLVSGPPSPVQEPVLPPLLPTPPVTSQLPISAAVSHSNFISSPPPLPLKRLACLIPTLTQIHLLGYTPCVQGQ